MRILLVSPYFPPQNAVASLRVHGFAKAWADAGEHVTVLTTAKRDDQRGLDLPRKGFNVAEIGYDVPAAFEWMRARHKRAPVNDGAVRTPSIASTMLRHMKERTGIFSSVRMPDLTDWWVRPAVQWARAQNTAWDLVLSSSGPYTAHLTASAVKSVGLAKTWVADFRDLWTDNHLHTGIFPLTMRERYLERQCLRQADLIIAATDGLAQKLHRKAARAVEVIYNGFDEADAASGRPPDVTGDGVIRLVYTGTWYPRGQDPSLLLAALSSTRNSGRDGSARLSLVIAGAGRDLWVRAAEGYGVSEMVEHFGLMSRTESLRLQSMADALILLDWNDPGQGVLTAKVFEYLIASAPILVIGGSPGSPMARLVERAGRGKALRTFHEIEQTLCDLRDRRVGLHDHPDRDFIRGLSRQRQSLRLLDRMRQLVSTPPATR